MSWQAKLNAYWRLTRMDKPIGIMLLLWPTLWGLWWASAGTPSLKLLLVFVLGTVLMRAAGCVVNDYADREFDRHVARTATRPITTGEVSGRGALIVAACLAAAAALLLLFLPPLAQMLALVAAVLAVSYPYFKRFFAIPQAYLGIAFGFGIPMAFAATHHALPAVAWYLLLANVFWTIAYDTEYAMVDKEDDLKIGIKTSAITFGRWDVLAVAVSYVLFLGIMAALGWVAQFKLGYFVVLGFAALIALRHVMWIRGRDRAACFRAFLHNHFLGATVFIATVLGLAR